MRYISELIDEKREIIAGEKSVILKNNVNLDIRDSGNRINILALGDVGGTVLLGLRLLGGDVVDRIGIYDLDEKTLRRYEREINQVRFIDGRNMPRVDIIDEAELFDCNVFVFCASKGVPPVDGANDDADVRMVQFEANSKLVKLYANMAAARNFKGMFAVVSDPVDPLCKAALDAGLGMEQVQGYGLGVMHARASYAADRNEEFSSFLTEGRAFGPHGEDLVIANSIKNYDDEISRRITELAVKSNMMTRADGFKPYIAPAMSSGAISIVETLKGGWNYSSVYLGGDENGAFLGCLNRRTEEGQEIEALPLDEKLFDRIERAYENLVSNGNYGRTRHE